MEATQRPEIGTTMISYDGLKYRWNGQEWLITWPPFNFE